MPEQPYPPGAQAPGYPYAWGQTQQPVTVVPPPPQRPKRGRKVALISCLSIVGLTMTLLVGFGTFLVWKRLNQHPAPGTDPSLAYSKIFSDCNNALVDKHESLCLNAFTGKAKEKQQRIIHNLLKVPFSTAKFEPYVKDSLYDGPTEVAFVHQVKGVDIAPVYEQYLWVFSEDSQGNPQITDIQENKKPDDGPQWTQYPAPWDVYDDMTVIQDGGTVVVTAKKNTAAARRYAPYIAKAAADDVAAWNASGFKDPRVGKGAFIVLEPDRTTYNELYSSGEDDNDSLEAGRNVPLEEHFERPEDERWGGSRIIMDSSLARFTSSSWRAGVGDISRHEIAHGLITTFDDARLSLTPPKWVSEGFADYMAMRETPQYARNEETSVLTGYHFLKASPDYFGNSDEFYSKSAKDRSAHYVLARMAMDYMAKTYGAKNMFRYVTATYEHPEKKFQNIDTYLGVPSDDFWAAYKQYVQARVPGVVNAY